MYNFNPLKLVEHAYVPIDGHFWKCSAVIGSDFLYNNYIICELCCADFYILTDFCLLILSSIERGVIKSRFMIMYFDFSFIYVKFCFTHFWGHAFR